VTRGLSIFHSRTPHSVLYSFVVLSILNSRQQTPVAKRTLNPAYTAKDATFDFPLYLSTADKLGALELVVWDKDVLSKDYLGEAALLLEDWFAERSFAFSDPGNTVCNVSCAMCSLRNTNSAVVI